MIGMVNCLSWLMFTFFEHCGSYEETSFCHCKHKVCPACIPTCTTITISTGHVLKKEASTSSSLHPWLMKTVASVIMDVSPYKGNPSTNGRGFCGQWTRFSTEPKESVCLCCFNIFIAKIYPTRYKCWDYFSR